MTLSVTPRDASLASQYSASPAVFRLKCRSRHDLPFVPLLSQTQDVTHRDRPLSQGHQHHGTARDPVKRPPMPNKRAVSCMSSTRCKRSRRAACWDLAPALASLLADSLHSYGHAAPGRHLVHGGLRRRTVDSGQRLGAARSRYEKKFGRNTSAQKVFSAWVSCWYGPKRLAAAMCKSRLLRIQV